MTKKTKASRPKGNGGKKYEGNKKPRKVGMFQALTKQKRASVAGGIDKSAPHDVKRKMKLSKRSISLPNEFRNFDERMAAKHGAKGSKSRAGALSTFVVAAPTFQFNANTMQPKTVVREVEGFDGFLAALEAPKDASTVQLNQVTRPAKPVQLEYGSSNVFAVLDEAEEERLPAPVQATPPAFMQPATFTFAVAKQTITPQSSLCLSTQLAAVEIDPDL